MRPKNRIVMAVITAAIFGMLVTGGCSAAGAAQTEAAQPAEIRTEAAEETAAVTEAEEAETEAPEPAAETDGTAAETAAADTETDVYGGGIFDTSVVHRIDIRIAPDDWADLLENPAEKTMYKSDITIDGEEIENVSCSTKGNSSLIFARDRFGNGRYSLKINFGKFEKGRSFHGLRKINLNNIFDDSTYMKDYLCYTMFRRAGVDAPYCSYAWLTINGADHGLFMIVEEIDESYLSRTGQDDAVLYKPDSDKLAAGGEEMARVIQNGVQAEDYGEGAELGYRGDSIEDYPAIFKNAETDADDDDKLRVIEALKGLSEGKDPEKYLYTDEIIRYFAVQSFVMNFDCYTGPMLHNYYLLENGGRLAMLPWDYNGAFGVFWQHIGGEPMDATAFANMGIDTPLLGSVEEQRPMWKWIADNDSFLEKYHRAMDGFLADYMESGAFEDETDALFELLLPYVEKDPTAFVSADRYTSSCKALRSFCLLRAESVRRQLDGDLAAKTKDQSPDDRVDASMITIDDIS